MISFSDPIIAPLWSDFVGSVLYRTTTDSTTLNRTAELITEQNSAYSDYHPTLAVVVTWHSVRSIDRRIPQVRKHWS